MVNVVLLAGVRGPCAGVSRAIEVAEWALDTYGTVYILHELVHNDYVFSRLESRGMILVGGVDDVPQGSVLLLSAHGTDRRIVQRARASGLTVIDAACPLVMKVHNEVSRYIGLGRKVIIAGDVNHVEIAGLIGQFESADDFYIIRTVNDVLRLDLGRDDPLAYVTQTTLSVSDASSIVDALCSKFSNIIGSGVKDVCFATHNRQEAVISLCKVADMIVVIGSQNSSNSRSLHKVAIRCGRESYLSDGLPDLALEKWAGVDILGITAGASAPDILVHGAIDKLRTMFPKLEVREMSGVVEKVVFAPPKVELPS